MVKSNLLEFEGDVVIVTGGARGIGKSTARAFSEQGARVVIVDIDRDKLEEAKESMRSDNEVRAISADVSKKDQVENVVKKVVEEFKRIDVLVNNAGRDMGSVPVTDVTDEMWETILRVNLHSVFYFCRCVIPVMIENGKGNIVNVASIAGKEANENMAPYAVSKAGMICLSRVLAKEVAKRNIRVNSVAPSLTRTDLLNELSPEQFEKLLEKIPMGRVGTSEEIANLILFLASDRATFITGQCYNISGGRGDY